MRELMWIITLTAAAFVAVAILNQLGELTLSIQGSFITLYLYLVAAIVSESQPKKGANRS